MITMLLHSVFPKDSGKMKGKSSTVEDSDNDDDGVDVGDE